MNEMAEVIELKEPKKYELRGLCSKDVFPMFKIISKIGIKEFKTCFESTEIKQLIASAATEGDSKDKVADTAKSVGISVVIDIASVVISNISACEDDIYLFLSQLSSMTKEDIANLDMVTFFEMIVDVFKKEEFKDFIGVVSKLFK